MARVEHVAIWTRDLERLRGFYERHLGAQAGAKYVNPVKRFESYFLTFDGGARLEIMTRPDVADGTAPAAPTGYAHVAFSVGSRKRVDELAAELRSAGVVIAEGPRQTGDGYYETVVLDPDGNRVEITV
jgi:lactoylglutathione lyase